MEFTKIVQFVFKLQGLGRFAKINTPKDRGYEQLLENLAGNIDRDASQIARESAELAEKTQYFCDRVSLEGAHAAVHMSNPLQTSLVWSLSAAIAAMDARRQTFYGLFLAVTGQPFSDMVTAYRSQRMSEIVGEFVRFGLQPVAVFLGSNPHFMLERAEKVLDIVKSGKKVVVSEDGTKLQAISVDKIEDLPLF